MGWSGCFCPWTIVNISSPGAENCFWVYRWAFTCVKAFIAVAALMLGWPSQQTPFKALTKSAEPDLAIVLLPWRSSGSWQQWDTLLPSSINTSALLEWWIITLLLHNSSWLEHIRTCQSRDRSPHELLVWWEILITLRASYPRDPSPAISKSL